MANATTPGLKFDGLNATLGGSLTIPTGSYDEIVFTGTGGTKILAPVEMYLQAANDIYLMSHSNVNLTLGNNTATFAGNVSAGTTNLTSARLYALNNSSSQWAGYFYNQNSAGIGLHVETNGHGTEQLLRLSSLDGSGGTNRVALSVLNNGNATFAGDVEIHNEGNDTTGKLTIAGNNNTGTPGQKTSGTIEHRGEHLKTVITHNGSDVITIGTGTQTTFGGNVFTPGLYVNATTPVAGTQVAIVQNGNQNLQRWGSSSDGGSAHSYRFRIDQNYHFIGNSGSGDMITIESNTGDITTKGDITTSSSKISVTQADGDDLAKLYQTSADGFLELFTGEATPVSRIKLSSYGDSYIAAASTGRVGIGTTSPSGAKVHIDSSDSGLKIVGSTRSQILLSNSTSTWQVESPTSAGNVPAGALGFIEAGVGSRLTILTGGNVGIGATDPGAKLQIYDGNPSSEFFRLSTNYDTSRSVRAGINWHDTANTTGRIYTEYDGTMVSMVFGSLYNSGYNSNNLMTIRGNGNVGIGATSPTKKLDVDGAIRTRNSFNISDGTTQIGGLFPHKVITGAGSDNSTVLFAETGLGLHFMTNGSASSKMVIESGGNVGIGEVAPAAKLQVSGDRDGTSEYVAILGEDGGATGAANSASTSPVHKTLLTGYSIPYSGQTNARLTSVGFLEFDSTPGWTGNQRNWALTSGYDMGGTGGPKFAILLGDAQNVEPQLGTNGAVGTGDGSDTLVATYWDNTRKMTHNGDATFIGDVIASVANNGFVRAAYDANNMAQLQANSSGGVFGANAGGTTKILLRSYGDSYFTGGNIGIGTTGPNTFLHVAGQGNRAGGNIHLGNEDDGAGKYSLITGAQYNAATEPEGISLIGAYSDSSSNQVHIGGMIWEANPATQISFWTHNATTHAQGGTERMRIDSGGQAVFYGDVTLDSDSTKLKIGDSQDLQLYHDGNHSYIANHTGELTITQNTDDGNIIFNCDNGSGGVHTYFHVDGGADRTIFSRSTRHNDNVVATFGTNEDLQIFHDGSHSEISESGQGDFRIRGDSIWFLQPSGTNQLSIYSGVVKLYYGGSSRIETSSGGVTVKGKITMDPDPLTGANYGFDVKGDINSVLALSTSGTIQDFTKGGSTGPSGEGIFSYKNFRDYPSADDNSKVLNIAATSGKWGSTSHAASYIRFSTAEADTDTTQCLLLKPDNSAEFAGNVVVAQDKQLQASRNTTTSGVAAAAASFIDHTTGSGNRATVAMEANSYQGARHIEFYGGSNVHGSISAGYNATAFNTSSDYRLKENVNDLSGALAKVDLLLPKTFTWKGDDENRVVQGFLAHEAQEVVPESVTGTKDETDENGKAVYQGIDQAKLVPLLTAAIKELKAQNEDLLNRVKALESK